MNSQIWKLAEELISTEVLINEYINLQDTLYSEAVILTEGLQEGTPRFLTDKLKNSEKEIEDPLLACFQSVGYLKKTLGKAMDLETAIVDQYKSVVNKRSLNSSKKVQKKGCVVCEESEILIEQLELELEKYKKSNANLNSQTVKLQKDLNGYKIMYNELKQSHEEVISELRAKVAPEDDRKGKSLTEKKWQDLDSKDKGLDITRKYENELNKNLKLQASYDRVLEESEIQQERIEKAQNIIKKLNEECEKLAKELFKVEEELEFYKKDSKGAEKLFFDARKKFFEFEGVKKAEERLREENNELKNKISEIFDKTEAEKNHLKTVIEGLVYDKKNLEKDLEDLEEKLNEIDEMNRNRVRAFNEVCEQNKVLSEGLEKQQKEMQAVLDDCKAQLDCKEAEKENIKKHAENLIRNLSLKANTENSAHPAGSSNSNSNFKALNESQGAVPGRSDNLSQFHLTARPNPESHPNLTSNTTGCNSKPTKTKLAELETLLSESKTREEGLKNLINKLLEKEKSFQIQSESTLNAMSSQFQANQESLLMRAEELENIIQDLEQKIQSLIRALSDHAKLIKIKDSQISDLEHVFKDLQDTHNKKSELLNEQNHSLREAISQEILPKSSKILDEHLDLAHKKIKNVLQDAEMTKVELEEARAANSRNNYRLELTQNEFCQTSRTLNKYEQELRSIKASVENPGLAINYEPSQSDSQITVSILKKIKEIYEYNLALIAQRTEARSMLEKLENERQLFVSDVALTKENFLAKEKMLQEENIRLAEQVQYMKSQACKDQEDISLIKEHWTEEVSFFKAQLEYIKGLLSDVEKEKFRVETDLKKSKSEYCELIGCFDRVKTEKNLLQQCYEELNHKIWSSTDRIRSAKKFDVV